ncbi:hypothetical protein NL676_027039 [Syzygium grande]|nr:hypothetical protein NL676_027039 [Syzygium grande]
MAVAHPRPSHSFLISRGQACLLAGHAVHRRATHLMSSRLANRATPSSSLTDILVRRQIWSHSSLSSNPLHHHSSWLGSSVARSRAMMIHGRATLFTLLAIRLVRY